MELHRRQPASAANDAEALPDFHQDNVSLTGQPAVVRGLRLPATTALCAGPNW